MSAESASNRAVFLSYASQDAAAARRIAEALRAAGVEVWLDQSELGGGDAWDRKIRGQIGSCALFVPVISRNTNARDEGYFRLEWKLAVDRTHLMAHDKPFLLPVVIDDTTDAAARVPPEFRAVQWTRLPGGETSEKFCARVQVLLGGSAMEPGRPRPGERGEGAASPIKTKPRRVPVAAWLGALAAVAVLAGYFVFNRSAPPASAPSPITPNPSPAAAQAADKSLVVLPLENLSPDPENAFFTEGMHAEITTTLSRISDLKVISRETAAALKGSTGSLADKARRVGVAHVVTGSVRRAHSDVRIVLELRRASDEASLWSQTYNKQLGEGVLAIQSDIAEQVARTLQARESKGTFAGAKFMTANPEAYDLFLKASQTHFAERTKTGRRKVVADLEQALALDPKFSSAASLLVRAHANGYSDGRDPEQRLKHAQDAKHWAEVARRLLPDGSGDGALSFYYERIEPDNARALALAENAVKALPNDAAEQTSLGLALRAAGRSAESVAAFQRAVSLDPFNRIFRGNLLNALGALRRVGDFVAAESDSGFRLATGRFALDGTLPAEGYENFVVWVQRGRRDTEALSVIEADLAETDLGLLTRWRRWIQKCDSLRRLRRDAEAAQAVQEAKILMEALNTAPAFDPSEADGRLAVTLARLGQADAAIAAGRRYVAARSPTNQVLSRWEREIELAQVYAYLNRPRECCDLLAKLLRVPSGLTVPMLKVEPDWDNVREDPAFKALLADPKNSAPL